MVFHIILAVPLGLVSVCLFTFLKTSIFYHIAVRNKSSEKAPPIIPYSVPWLGQTLGFLTPVSGLFLSKLLSWYPKKHGAAELKIAGRNVHMIFSTTAVQALLKAKHTVANSDTMIKDMLRKGLGMSESDYLEYMEPVKKGRQMDYDAESKFLLRQSGADALARGFTRFMKDGIATEGLRLDSQAAQGEVVDLYAWLRPLMFKASTTTFFGQRLFDEYPDLSKDFWVFEPGFLDLMFGVPTLFKSESQAAQERVLQGLTRWIEAGDREMGGKVPDPNVPDQDWEPRWGSRLIRAREAIWHHLGLSSSGRASIQLGMMFALNANALPSTGWMLMRILDPNRPDIFSRVMEEIREAVHYVDGDSGDFEIDANILISQPLLQSIFQEVLRFYVDVLVTRGVQQDMKLPMEESRTLLIKKGTIAIAPSYVNHYDPTGYAGAPIDVFDGERFLVLATEDGHDDDSGNEKSTKVSKKPYMFSPGAAGNKMIPFGGGRTMCPGRVFAKREVFLAVALILLNFEVTPLGEARSYKPPGTFPAYSGVGVNAPGGDIKVHIKRRTAN